MKEVFILTEGGSKYGYGHITRCSALYDEILKQGANPVFYLRGDPEPSYTGKRTTNFTDWNDKNFIKNISSDTYIIIDSYNADYQFCNELVIQAKRVLFIDDNNRLDYPGGIIVNPSLYGKNIDYTESKTQDLLLGPEYIILRPEFTSSPRKFNQKVSRVLITMGGADIRNLTPLFLNMINDISNDIIIDVVIGPGFENVDKITKASTRLTNLHFNVDSSQMSELMKISDFAISASGQTIHELLFNKIPFIAVNVIDNQNNNFNALKSISSGNIFTYYHNEILSIDLNQIFNSINFNTAPSSIEIDNKGTFRIIKKLLEI
ncbi:MAG: hypothetical protein JXR95_15220 [Deltaproteobacteria bacterium]|nr:hypothetical protein [Deltaproteobacteria bacterium]